MTRSKSPAPTPPREALPDGEPNPHLKKLKSSLSKRWAYARMETLYEIFELSACLWVLDREREAMSLAEAVARAIPAPPPLPRGRVNYNLWCPATYSHALIARVHDPDGASFRTLVADPGVSRSNPAFVVAGIREAPREVEKAFADPSVKSACHVMAQTLGRLLLDSVLDRASDPLVAGLHDDIERGMILSRSRLRATLEPRPPA